MSKPNTRDIRDVALGKLAYRQRTVEELRKQLLDIGYGAEEINALIEEFVDYGYLNDIKYACSFFNYAESKGWAFNRARRELRSRGVSDEDIKDGYDEWLNNMELNSGNEMESSKETEREKAFRVALKMVDSNDLDERGRLPEKIKSRIARKLYSYGYGSDNIYSVTRNIEEELVRGQDLDSYVRGQDSEAPDC